jgi:tRNA dimethylallyltransferase
LLPRYLVTPLPRYLVTPVTSLPRYLKKIAEKKNKFATTIAIKILMNQKKINLICVLGPTASGKTRFAAVLAHSIGGEIISADSRQVYRGMDIGTGKDYTDYLIENTAVPYHLIDIVNAGVEYNVFEYQKDFYRVFNEIQDRGIMPVVCGGTGLYIEAVLKGYRLLQVPVNESLRLESETQSIASLVNRLKSYKNPHNTSDTLIRKRLIRAIEIEEYLLTHPVSQETIPEIHPVIFGMDIDRELRREKISLRLKQRLEQGMIVEVKQLLASGISAEKLEYYGLEYKFVSRYAEGKISYDEMYNSLNIAIHQFAKRQMTWFRKMEKEGTKIHWIDAEKPMDEKIQFAKKILDTKSILF